MAEVKIAIFDLAAPASVWGLEGCLTAWIVVRSGATLIGMLRVELLGRNALAAADVCQLALDEFGPTDAAVDRQTRPVPVSVIICTRNRPRALRRCLDAVARLDHPNFEVIVVDNGSAGRETEAVIRATPFRYVREDRPGLDNARNRGWSEARHDVVAYIDDDTVVDPFWLRAVAQAFDRPDTAVVTGLVLPFELDFLPQVLFEAYGGMSKGFAPQEFAGPRMSASGLISAHRVGVGANMSFRRTVLEELGGFDPALDVGTVSGGGGDLDMFHRVLVAGLTIRYEPSAMVWHQHRRGRVALRRQIYFNGRSFGVYLGKIWAKQSVPRRDVVAYAIHDWGAGWLMVRAWRSLTHPGSRNAVGAWAELLGVVTAPWACWRGRSGPAPRLKPRVTAPPAARVEQGSTP